MPYIIATYFLVPDEGTTPEGAARWVLDEEIPWISPVISTRMEDVRRRDGEVPGAMQQAVDGRMEGLTLGEYAKDHDELAQALARWGVVHA